MKRSLIPWRVFREALNAQLTARDLENWLAFWCFGDDGVAILQDETGIKEIIALLFPDEKAELIH